MSLSFFRMLHFTGNFLILFTLGAVLLRVITGGGRQYSWRVPVSATHGIGMLLSIMGGFGALGLLETASALPLWVILKIVIWLALGGILGMIYRMPQQAKKLWWVTLALMFAATALASFKPF